MLALIDGDIVTYRCAASAENNTELQALWRVDDLIERILREVGATSYKIFITGKHNFRYDFYPQYKANRKGKPDPKWLLSCNEHLVLEWKAKITDGYEADDALGINQTNNSIICSIDKDLLQIPGEHWNFIKGIDTHITLKEGEYNFYHQLLTGDRTDNLFGIYGIGKSKATKILNSTEDWFEAVRRVYKDDAKMLLNGKLTKILQEEDGIWTHPNLPEELLIGLNLSELGEEVK